MTPPSRPLRSSFLKSSVLLAGFRKLPGTAVDAKGRQLSHDLITESLAAIEIDFDEAGNAKLPPLVAGPALIQDLGKLPPPTEEQTARKNAMMKEKRKALNPGRGHRHLP